MLLYPLPALLIPFPRTFNVEGNANNQRNSLSCPFPDLMSLFLAIPFISEEGSGCTNEEAIGAINKAAIGDITAPRNLSSHFFISNFTVSVAPSINRCDFSSDSTILIISSISSFEKNKVNSFSAPHPLMFFSNLSNTKLL